MLMLNLECDLVLVVQCCSPHCMQQQQLLLPMPCTLCICVEDSLSSTPHAGFAAIAPLMLLLLSLPWITQNSPSNSSRSSCPLSRPRLDDQVPVIDFALMRRRVGVTQVSSSGGRGGGGSSVEVLVFFVTQTTEPRVTAEPTPFVTTQRQLSWRLLPTDQQQQLSWHLSQLCMMLQHY